MKGFCSRCGNWSDDLGKIVKDAYPICPECARKVMDEGVIPSSRRIVFSKKHKWINDLLADMRENV